MTPPADIVERVALAYYNQAGAEAELPPATELGMGDEIWRRHSRAALAALTLADLAALIAARDPQWVVVPREASAEMLAQAEMAYHERAGWMGARGCPFQAAYRSAIGRAPAPGAGDEAGS